MAEPKQAKKRNTYRRLYELNLKYAHGTITAAEEAEMHRLHAWSQQHYGVSPKKATEAAAEKKKIEAEEKKRKEAAKRDGWTEDDKLPDPAEFKGFGDWFDAAFSGPQLFGRDFLEFVGSFLSNPALTIAREIFAEVTDRKDLSRIRGVLNREKEIAKEFEKKKAEMSKAVKAVNKNMKTAPITTAKAVKTGDVAKLDPSIVLSPEQQAAIQARRAALDVTGSTFTRPTQTPTFGPTDMRGYRPDEIPFTPPEPPTQADMLGFEHGVGQPARSANQPTAQTPAVPAFDTRADPLSEMAVDRGYAAAIANAAAGRTAPPAPATGGGTTPTGFPVDSRGSNFATTMGAVANQREENAFLGATVPGMGARAAPAAAPTFDTRADPLSEMEVDRGYSAGIANAAAGRTSSALGPVGMDQGHIFAPGGDTYYGPDGRPTTVDPQVAALEAQGTTISSPDDIMGGAATVPGGPVMSDMETLGSDIVAGMGRTPSIDIDIDQNPGSMGRYSPTAPTAGTTDRGSTGRPSIGSFMRGGRENPNDFYAPPVPGPVLSRETIVHEPWGPPSRSDISRSMQEGRTRGRLGPGGTLTTPSGRTQVAAPGLGGLEAAVTASKAGTVADTVAPPDHGVVTDRYGNAVTDRHGNAVTFGGKGTIAEGQNTGREGTENVAGPETPGQQGMNAGVYGDNAGDFSGEGSEDENPGGFDWGGFDSDAADEGLGYRYGGYTGAGQDEMVDVWEPAGVVHEGEYVIPKEAVEEIGLPVLDQLRSLGKGKQKRMTGIPVLDMLAMMAVKQDRGIRHNRKTGRVM